MPRSFSTSRLTVDAVLRMATEQAQRHASLPAGQQASSPALSQAVDQVWQLVKGRLGASPEVERLDALIGKVVGRP